MVLRRRADDLILCDRIWSSKRWDKLGRTPSCDTITGVRTVFARQKAQQLSCKVMCTFASDGRRLSLANLDNILRLHEANQLLSFTVREGTTRDVRILDWSEPETSEETKTKTVQNVTFELMDPPPRWY